MDMVEKTRLELEFIQANNPKKDEELYLIHNILAEIGIAEENINDTYLNYEKAVEYASSNSNKVSIYGKLVFIAETNQDKVFIFNGWTFASTPTLKSVDHPIYDVWLVGCENV